MKQTAVRLLVIVALHVVSSGNNVFAQTNQTQFFICRQGKAECRIAVASGDGMPQEWQERALRLAQSLQTYLNRLTGVVIPVEGYASHGTNDSIKNEIEFLTPPRPQHPACFTVSFQRDRQGNLLGPPIQPRVTLRIDADSINPYCARAAVSNFVEKAFGPPLSAIDDPNYKWPKKTTLVIDADKFETIQYPPETHKPPRYLNSPNEKK